MQRLPKNGTLFERTMGIPDMSMVQALPCKSKSNLIQNTNKL